MKLRGWMVLTAAGLIGVFVAYLVAAFVCWDWLFFSPEKMGSEGRVVLALFAVFAATLVSVPFVKWSVDIDMRNRR